MFEILIQIISRNHFGALKGIMLVLERKVLRLPVRISLEDHVGERCERNNGVG